MGKFSGELQGIQRMILGTKIFGVVACMALGTYEIMHMATVDHKIWECYLEDYRSIPHNSRKIGRPRTTDQYQSLYFLSK